MDATRKDSTAKTMLIKLWKHENIKTLLALLLLSVLVYIFRPDVFLSQTNLFNIARQTSVNAIMAIGITFVIVTGGIDLSIGSVAGFSAIIMAFLLKDDYNLFLVLVAGGVVGILCGCVSGTFISKVKIAPFIVTMAMMTILRGAITVLSQGKPITNLGDDFGFIGTGHIRDVPFPVICMIIIAIAAHYVINHTPFGRHVYAVGGNEEAARLSGINVDFIKICCYSICAFLATVSGAIMAARVNSATPLAGDGAELDAIAAAVIGGISLSGGKGTIIGALIGALIIGVLNNGIILLDIDVFYTKIVKGVVILVAVILDRMNRLNEK